MGDYDAPLYELVDPGADCDQQLGTVKEAVEQGDPEIRHVDKRIADCAVQEPQLGLEIIETLVQEESVYHREIEYSLQAIGTERPELAIEFFETAVGDSDYPQKYLASYVPHLFSADTDRLCDQLEQWYESSPRFFELAVEQLFKTYHQARRSDAGLENNGEEVVGTLTDIAETAGIDITSALESDTEDTLVTGSLILDDFRHQPDSNLDTYGIGVDLDRIEENVGDYPWLSELLGDDPVDRLNAAGSYQLPRLLSHEIDRGEARAILRRRGRKRDWSQEGFEVASVAMLAYLNHCCETIDFDQDRYGSLTDMLLDRDRYGAGLAELDVCNALRREFVDREVEMEPPVGGKKPDFGFPLDGDRHVWVEVTRARETTEKRLGDVYSPARGTNSRVRTKVTDKTRDQISEIKTSNPDDLTMVVLKNEHSAVTDALVREYAIGATRYVVGPDLDDPEGHTVPGGPVAIKDDHSSSSDDEGIEHLDILTNFDYTGDFYSKPFISGQVFAFSDSVPDPLLYRLEDAFNAGEHVYRTPFAEEE